MLAACYTRSCDDGVVDHGDDDLVLAVEQMLYDLCVTGGYCLPPSAQEALLSAPPATVEAFTDAVLAAEGLDPELANREQRRALQAAIQRWFELRPVLGSRT
jgi:hypothetical protein